VEKLTVEERAILERMVDNDGERWPPAVAIETLLRIHDAQAEALERVERVRQRVASFAGDDGFANGMLRLITDALTGEPAPGHEAHYAHDLGTEEL
jgi:hypothetical protein